MTDRTDATGGAKGPSWLGASPHTPPVGKLVLVLLTMMYEQSISFSAWLRNKLVLK